MSTQRTPWTPHDPDDVARSAATAIMLTGAASLIAGNIAITHANPAAGLAAGATTCLIALKILGRTPR